MAKKNLILLIILVIVVLFLSFFDLTLGDISISFSDIKDIIFSQADEDISLVFKEFRFPRVMAAILCGAALLVAGLVMQSLFRNPLAGPSILGISSGASLGVAVVVMGSSLLNINILNSNLSLVIAGAIGAASVLLLIILVSFRIKDMVSILIIGILISGVITAIINVLQYFANNIYVKSYVIWTMGSLTALNFSDIYILFPLIVIVLLLTFLMSKKLNLLLLGEEIAITMGVNIKAVKLILFSLMSILTGAITVYCGPIAFIGIVTPHIARRTFNSSNHFLLIPASILYGIMFLLLGDIIVNLMPMNGVLPINSITSILGAPFIIWIIVKNKRTFI